MSIGVLGWFVESIKRHRRGPVMVLTGAPFGSDSPRTRELLAKRAIDEAFKPKAECGCCCEDHFDPDCGADDCKGKA